MKITKRNGTEQDFDQDKILSAITRANATVPEQDRLTDAQIKGIVAGVVCSATTSGSQPTVESVQDSVEDWLMGSGKHKVAKAYITYRYLHQLARDHYRDLMTRVGEKVHATKVANQNANVDEESFGGRLGESASLVMRELAMNGGMSKLAAENHKNNMIYTHDLDHFVLGTHNCLSVPMDKLLAEGFAVKQTDIRPAQSINTACQLVAVIFQIQSLQQFGGVAATHLDYTLSKYVIKSLFKHYILELLKQSEVFDSWDVAKYSVMKLDAKLDEVKSKLKSKLDESEFRIYLYEDDIPEHIDRKIYKRALLETRIELEQAIEGLYHNLNSLQSRSGNQLPFTSLNYGTCTEPEGRLVTEQVLCTSIRGIGKKDRTPIFPCGIFQLKDGINKKYTDPNYDLFRLALRSTALRLYPNYVNCDWSAQKAWLKADRDFRKQLLAELTEDQRTKLISKLEASEYLRRRFRMNVAHYPDGSKLISVYHKEEPNEIMSTMGALAGTEHLYVKLEGEILDVAIQDFFRYCKTGVLKNARPAQIHYNKERLDLPGDRTKQSKSGIKVGSGVYAITYMPEDVTYIGSSSNVNRRLTEHRSTIRQTGGIDAGPSFGDNNLCHYKFEVLEYCADYKGAEKKYIETIPNINIRGTAQLYYKAPHSSKWLLEPPFVHQDLYVKQELIDLNDRDIKVLDRDNRWVKVKHIFKNDSRNTPHMMHVLYREVDGTECCLNCTEDHPLWTGEKYERTDHIKPGQFIYRADNTPLEVLVVAYHWDTVDSYDIGTATGSFIGSDIIMHNCRTANGLDLHAFESIRKNLYAVLEDKPFYDDIESAVQKDGRGNICPVTIIMPTLAMEADRDVEKFMKLLDTMIHEAKDQLIERYEYICSQSWRAAKFMYSNGSMAGYVPEEGIRSALRHGTIVIGQLGLAETLQALIGKDHTTEEGMQLAIRIEALFKLRVAEFREKYQLNFGVYYTPEFCGSCCSDAA